VTDTAAKTARTPAEFYAEALTAGLVDLAGRFAEATALSFFGSTVTGCARAAGATRGPT